MIELHLGLYPSKQGECMHSIFKIMAIAQLITLTVACTSTTPPTPQPDTKPAKGTIVYPETKRVDVQDTLHGTLVQDPYRWLEDDKSPEVQAWMTKQHAFTQKHLDNLAGRDALAKRFSELFYIDATTAPTRRGERFFWWKRAANQEKYVSWWKQGKDGEAKVLIDPNAMSKDGSISLKDVSVSPKGTYAAYALSENNADEAKYYVMEIATGKVFEQETLTGMKYAWPSWMPDESGFYYTHLPKDPNVSTQDRPGLAQVRFHALGTPQSADPIVVPKTGDPKIFMGASVTRNGKFLTLYKQYGWNANDIFVHEITDKASRTKPVFKPLVEGIEAKFSAAVWKGDMYIRTNHNAPNYKILKLSTQDLDYAKAKVIVAEDKEEVLQSMDIIGNQLVLMNMKKVTNNIRVHTLDGTIVRDVKLPTVGAVYGIKGEPEYDEAYFSFTSFTVPSQIYSTDVKSGDTALWSKSEVPIDPKPYKVEQVFYTSKDGTKVPMFVITRKDIKLDGKTPFILNGYGGFNVSLKPYFRASIYPWLEAGGGYAIANLRGGGEFGESWHQAGMLGNKQNVFDDFIAAAEHLQTKGYTSPDKLAISGGSNGGLLVGAAMTQRPELFRAVVCAVPLLDMVRYHLSGSGKTWIAEYGSADDADQFMTLFKYSPYHQVKQATAYPATLFASADSDDRVDPLHARKMAAAVQHANTSAHPILLRIEKNAGHGGGDMVKKSIKSNVDTYSFLMCELGINQCNK